jgi:D-glycero-D-manno-heptose 1,7-bisphosphate phosphatase
MIFARPNNSTPATARPALFLDRDGIINVDTDFAHRPEDIIFQPGIFDLVNIAIRSGFVPVVVTNQSGIARAHFSEAAFQDLTAWMLKIFADAGTPIARVYYCPFHPEAEVAMFRHEDHPWRKPRPGMFHAAEADLGVDLACSVMIGDRWSDAKAAWSAGIRVIAIVGDRADREGEPPPYIIVDRLASVSNCVQWLQGKIGTSPQLRRR